MPKKCRQAEKADPPVLYELTEKGRLALEWFKAAQAIMKQGETK